MKILLSIFIILILFIIIVFIVAAALSTKPYKGPISDHFDGKKFINKGRNAKGFKDVSTYATKRVPDKWVENYETYVRTKPIPIPQPTDIQYTFINHSSFLIQHAGCNILTDPIWSKRCSPLQFAGPKRMRPPGIDFNILPNIDVVLLSHNHYDHLDKNTIKKINKKFQPIYIVPLGMTQIMKHYGCKKIIELDWWQTHVVQNIEITATPANHFSSRGILDRNTSLWSGFFIKSDSKKIYFAGDTGYSNVFKEIGDRLGPMDLSFIPIGAYLPEWFMSPIHVNPHESVLIHHEVRSIKSVAMHFGTFPLADDNPQRSTSRLEKAKNESNLTDKDFSIPDEGFVYRIAEQSMELL